VKVKELRAVMYALDASRESTADELVEKRVALLAAVGDAGEGGVLPLDA
jgi:hypothetical protein